AGGPPAEPAGTNGVRNKTGGEAGGRVATLVGYGPRTGTAKRRPRKAATAPAASTAPAAPAAPAGPTAPAVPAVTAAPVPPEVVAAAPEVQGGYVPLAKPPVRKLAKELGIDLHALAGSGPHGVLTRED